MTKEEKELEEKRVLDLPFDDYMSYLTQFARNVSELTCLYSDPDLDKQFEDELREVGDQARVIEKVAFQREILRVWYYDFVNPNGTVYDKKAIIDLLAMESPIQLVHAYYYQKEKNAFLTNNWDRIPEILKFLQNYYRHFVEEDEKECQ